MLGHDAFDLSMHRHGFIIRFRPRPILSNRFGISFDTCAHEDTSPFSLRDRFDGSKNGSIKISKAVLLSEISMSNSELDRD